MHHSHSRLGTFLLGAIIGSLLTALALSTSSPLRRSSLRSLPQSIRLRAHPRLTTVPSAPPPTAKSAVKPASKMTSPSPPPAPKPTPKPAPKRRPRAKTSS